MSQPEMRPEGASRKRGDRRGDLLGLAFPLGDWAEPAERLDELYVWAEQRALRIADRYLAGRVWKRRGSRALRAGAASCVVAGTVLTLLELTGALGGRYAAWGALALLGAALCLGCDRHFGLTRGWMRDVGTAQAVQRRLECFQYDWAAENIREVLGPTQGSTAEAADRALAVVRRFSEDVTEIVGVETADWMLMLSAPHASQAARPFTVPSGRRAECGSGGGSGSGHGVTNGYRFPLPPGTHPSMPRQRPPEGPR